MSTNTTNNKAASNYQTLVVSRIQSLLLVSVVACAATLMLNAAFMSLASSAQSLASTPLVMAGMPLATVGVVAAHFLSPRLLDLMWRLAIPRTALCLLGLSNNLFTIPHVPSIGSGFVLLLSTISVVADIVAMSLGARNAYELSTQLQIEANRRFLTYGPGAAAVTGGVNMAPEATAMGGGTWVPASSASSMSSSSGFSARGSVQRTARPWSTV